MTELFGGPTTIELSDEASSYSGSNPAALATPEIVGHKLAVQTWTLVGAKRSEEPKASKYSVWHDQIISRAQKRKTLGCYRERHHIMPRSFGGGDQASNLVDLTYREHFLVHWLLTKICEGGERRRMQQAMLALVVVYSWPRDHWLAN